jgi:protein-tyrosine phosphatase
MTRGEVYQAHHAPLTACRMWPCDSACSRLNIVQGHEITYYFPSPEMRLLPLVGGNNLRDLGGYVTVDGRVVKRGLLIRSGSLAELTDADWRHLLEETGVRTLCDLRTTPERAEAPFAQGWIGRISYRIHDYEATFADLRRTIDNNLATPEEARASMLAGYRELPFALAPAYRQLFACLRDGAVPLLFNCTGGKDRTGLAAALVLGALGVPRDTVIEDYLLTNRLRRWPAWAQSPESADDREGEIRKVVLWANTSYLTAALDSVDARCGSLEAYLADLLDTGPVEVELIKSVLLD